MRKISFLQFISILLISRLVVTMVYSPHGAENSLVEIIGGLASGAIQAVVVAAPIALVKKFPDKNVVELGYGISKPVGVSVALIYLVFTVWVAVKTICDFSAFITYAFPIFTAKKMIVIFMAAAALYISLLGIEPIVRSAIIVLALFIIMLAAVLLGTSGNIDIHNMNLAVEDPLRACLMSGIDGAGRNTCIVAACLLLPHLRSGQAGALYGYLGIKYAVISLIIFLYTAILGEFAYSAQLPFFHLSSYSDSHVIARFDSLFLIVWTMCAVMKVALYFWLAGNCIKSLSPHITTFYANTGVCIVSAAAVIALSRYMDIELTMYPLLSLSVLVLLAGVIPALMLLRRKEKA